VLDDTKAEQHTTGMIMPFHSDAYKSRLVSIPGHLENQKNKRAYCHLNKCT